jgi:hypothetical protein
MVSMSGLDELESKRRDFLSPNTFYQQPVATDLDIEMNTSLDEGQTEEMSRLKRENRVLGAEASDSIDTVGQMSLTSDPSELSPSLEKSGNELNARLVGAVGDNDFPRVRILLENGASVNARKLGWTALMRACRNKNKAIVDLLLERGAAVNETSTLEGETALMLSIKEGDENTFMLLLDHRADITQKNNVSSLF